MKSTTLIAIPAFNEASKIAEVIHQVKNVLPQVDILVVDDGSTDGTASIAKAAGALVLIHKLNRGLGGSIGTALLYAKRHQIDYLATIDADGQHDPQDLIPALHLLTSHQADIVIGSRMKTALQLKSMPRSRIIINKLANLLTFLLYGLYTTDSQSGFRAFNKKTIQSLELRTDRMEVSTEIFSEIKRLKLKYQEIPIQVIYSAYSLQKGQTTGNSLAIFFRLMLRLFR